MAEETLAKWEGKVTAELKGATAEQIWPLLEDFCGLDKIFPDLKACYQVEGAPGQPGQVRRCEGKLGWANEKLLTIDPTTRCLSYEVMENTAGLKNYVATVIVLPVEATADDGKPQGQGCIINWSFTSDPIQSWSLEGLVSYLDNTLQLIAKKMEDTVTAKPQI